jgi:hypothetical protein
MRNVEKGKRRQGDASELETLDAPELEPALTLLEAIGLEAHTF